MSATHPRKKATAVLWLAAGKSMTAAAEAAGVSAGTVSRWRKDRVFAAEVEATRAVYGQKPQDGAALLEHLEQVERRLSPPAPEVTEGGGFRVQVAIPPGSSPRRVEQLTARAIAKGLRAARRAQS
jgi:transcriptional regulator with XRE-family HTH domain